MRAESRRRRAAREVFFYLAASAASLAMIYPILWLAASSFKAPDEMWRKVYSLVPEHFTWVNYAKGWRGFGGIHFEVFYKNSAIYAGLGTLLCIASSAFVAYGFARVEFRGKGLCFSAMLLTLMVPPQIQIIPQYVMFAKLGWVNSYLPLFAPKLFGQAFFIFMFVQFLRGIPRELDEAAAIDGASRLVVFTKVLLPLLKPALFTGSIFSFYWTWNEFMTPLIYINNPKNYTLSMALRSFADPSGLTDWGAIFAMSFLSLVPIFALFVAFQSYLVQGIATTGLKG
jgi:multiple sugar transport system permease protein